MANKRDNKNSKKPANQGGEDVPKRDTRFKPGQSGNPKGRPSAGASIKEWYNIMLGWTPAEIRAVIKDRKSPVAKRAAARDWLCAEKERDDPGKSVERIINHTDGKARQGVDHTIGGIAGLGIKIVICDGPAPVLPPAPVQGIDVTKAKELPGDGI